MSVPQVPGPPDSPPRGGFGLGAALMVLFGVLLLLPGLCALFSAFVMMPMVWRDPSTLTSLGLLWAFCILVSYGGIKLIQRGSRG